MKKSYFVWLVPGLSFLLFIVLTQYYQHRYMLSTETTVTFESNTTLATLLQESSPGQPIKVIYFWQSYCPCDATVIGHFTELQKEYSGLGVEFLLADMSPSPRDDQLGEFERLPADQLEQLKGSVSFTPAVAVYEASGKLSYYGPHNLGFVCNAKTSFVLKVLDGLLSGAGSSNTRTFGDGCFCAVEPKA